MGFESVFGQLNGHSKVDGKGRGAAMAPAAATTRDDEGGPESLDGVQVAALQVGEPGNTKRFLVTKKKKKFKTSNKHQGVRWKVCTERVQPEDEPELSAFLFTIEVVESINEGGGGRVGGSRKTVLVRSVASGGRALCLDSKRMEPKISLRTIGHEADGVDPASRWVALGCEDDPKCRAGQVVLASCRDPNTRLGPFCIRPLGSGTPLSTAQEKWDRKHQRDEGVVSEAKRLIVRLQDLVAEEGVEDAVEAPARVPATLSSQEAPAPVEEVVEADGGLSEGEAPAPETLAGMPVPLEKNILAEIRRGVKLRKGAREGSENLPPAAPLALTPAPQSCGRQNSGLMTELRRSLAGRRKSMGGGSPAGQSETEESCNWSPLSMANA